ncbi:sodium/calcium exchanger family protein / calcium-binding EF hand family protein [Euphorbia peplus]|nr:sodium/calcium exchanger family protein / calcium-binding EF hand family protein [Euphorbia peplus]
MAIIKEAFCVLVALAAVHVATSRTINEYNSKLSLPNETSQSKTFLEGNGVRATTVTCEPAYFFLPCTSNVWGEVFLLFVYEYLLSLSAQYIAQGSELFLETSGTQNVFSANIFQMLGMFPQMIVLLVSAFSGTADTVEIMAEMGMGMMAGSVIMNLTIVWGSVVAFGCYDISESSTSSNTNTQTKSKFSLNGYGVKTDIQTKHTAFIMMLSMIPFLLLQLTTILSSTSAKKVVIVVCLVITVLYFVGYMTYQALTPWIKERRLEYLMRKYIQNNLLQALRMSNGNPNQEAISELFRKVDQNDSKEITAAELRALVVGMQVQEFGLNADDFVSKLLTELDKSADSTISETEFNEGISRLLSDSNVSGSNQARQTKKKSAATSTNSQGNTEDLQQSLLRNGTTTSDENAVWNYIKAALLILCGSALTFVLAAPLMTSIQELATAINIPSFLVSYVVLPLAMGFKMVFRSITSAMDKSQTAVSLTLSELYGGVFMNNVMGLMIFLALVCIKDIAWDVSAEVLTVLIICSLIGVSATFSSKFPVWTSIIAYALYPLSLAFIYLLTTLLGWG